MAARQPRYEALSKALRQKIEGGAFPVGTPLPPERQMSLDLGVSRATVREALRRLEFQGLIQRRQGAGTVVLATRPKSYTMQLRSLETFSLYDGDETWLDILRLRDARDGDIAHLDLDTETGWLCCEAMRRHIHSGQPAAYTEAFVRTEYRAIFDHEKIGAEPFYKLMREIYGLKMHDAVVDFFPGLASPAARHHFAPDAPEDAVMPAIRLIRSFYDLSGRLCQRSETWHCGDVSAFRAEIALPR